MINLIPNEEQKNITKGFFLRLVVVFIFLFSFCLIATLIIFVPSYLISINKERIAKNKLEIQKNETIPQLDQNSLTLIKDLDNKLKIIENSDLNKFNISENIIDQIILNKMPDIKINRFSFVQDIVEGKKVSIYGTAPSRERLLLFKKALESSSYFLRVDLPVSNFIKGSDINFYLSLIAS
jgi:hypothetical protein